MYKNVIYTLNILLSLSTFCTASQFKSSNVEKKYFLKNELVIDEKLKQNLRFGFSSTTGNAETMYFNGRYTLSFTQSGYHGLTSKIFTFKQCLFQQK